MRTADPVNTELSLQTLLRVYIATGLLFMLLPGTFLGVWNLLSISAEHTVESLSPAWLQAHGHAQIFGWLGTFIIGIGYYSLTKMGNVMPFAVRRGWASWGLWTGGIALRWLANVTEWNWRVLLPLSAACQLVAFGIFYFTVRNHKPATPAAERKAPAAWTILVIASTLAFLLALVINQLESTWLAFHAAHPEIPHRLDQRYLFVAGWGFPVLAVWGFSGRWLPVFVGLRDPQGRKLLLALGLLCTGLVGAVTGHFQFATIVLFAASALAADGLNVFRRSLKPAKTLGVSPVFPYFTRIAYGWLLMAATLGIYAAKSDHNGGIWGASRHALT